MKKITLLMLLMLSALFSKAQDVMTMKNGNDLKVVITEISDTEIRYKKFENQSGPTYVIKKTEVFMITYSNGTREVISPEKTPAPAAKNNQPQLNRRKSNNDDRVRYGGPRLGCTYFSPGTNLTGLKMLATGDPETNIQPFISQFGWQFETRFFTLENGGSGLLEFVAMIGGMERGIFLPSASGLIGFRTKEGHEIGVGPNYSRSGLGVVLAAGTSFTVGKVIFPINLAYMPSVQKMQSAYAYDPVTRTYQYYHQTMPTGHRISLLIGFNTKSKNHQ